MADEGEYFDPCECISGHQAAMRRLMAYLRQSQSYCTDTQCYPEMPGTELQPPMSNYFLLMVAALGLAMFMLAIRPAYLQSSENGKSRRNNGSDNDSAPPPQF